MAMLYLVVYPWRKSDTLTEFVAVVTDVPRNFTDVIFSENFNESSEEEVTKRARTEARKRGIVFVQGLDETPPK